jgi:hypothetical protein
MRCLGLWFAWEDFTKPNLIHDDDPEEKFRTAIM